MERKRKEESKMEMFKKPSWLKPEINEPKYYLHLLIISVVVSGILQLWKGGNMFNIQNVLWSIPLLLAGDVVAHSLLKMN
jgi:hypothetical protein